MKTSLIPLDYDYFDWQDKNYARIVCRDDKGKRVLAVDECPVYLWAILKDGLSIKKINEIQEKISKIKLDVKGRQTKVEKVELKNKKFLGKQVKALKIHATNYKDLHDIADKLGMKEIEKRRGYDLGYITHYIIEKKFKPLQWHEVEGEILANSEEYGKIDSAYDVDYCIKIDSIKSAKEKKFEPKVFAFDIETDAFKIGEGEILMISIVGKNFKKVISWKKSKEKPKYVEYVKDEAELIEKFIEIIKEESPDILTGYFSDGFDMPYLKARAQKLGVKLSLGLEGSEPRFSRGATMTAKTKGVVHVDLLKFIRTAYAQYMQSETLSLNEVAKEFLGDEKKKFEFKHSSKIKDWEEYFEYNLHDSKLTYDLFEKFWPDMLEFVKVIEEPLFDLSRAGLSKYTENYILHNLEDFDEIPEKRPGHGDIGERRSRGVQGAFVYEPKPGLYEDIAMFDFTSMHTSIIITHNISKETYLEQKEKGAFESPEIGKKKYYFSKEPGFFPELLKKTFDLRKKYKAEYKKNPNAITKARSNAFKVLSASAHGYIGFFGARYYSYESSATILALVRKYNKEIIEKIEKLGHPVIYGDTDSTAFLTNKKSKKEIKELLKKLNDKLPGVMHLEMEDIYKRGIWVTTRGGTTGAKKKYALIDEKGEVKIRGFETVRRDWCKLSRELQDKVIRQILKDGDDKKAMETINETIKKIKKREIPIEDLVIRTQLKKPIEEYKSISPHVVAAKRMKEKEIPVTIGNMVEYYIAETPGKSKLVRDKVKLPDEKGLYDIKYYLERQILPAVENIMQVFKINAKEMTEGKKQTTLGDF